MPAQALVDKLQARGVLVLPVGARHHPGRDEPDGLGGYIREAIATAREVLAQDRRVAAARPADPLHVSPPRKPLLARYVTK